MENVDQTASNILSETLSIEELEDILHGGQLSCNHVDEVWPNLFLGDMYMSHDRYGLWRLGITHVLNAAHGKMCCKGSDDFYGTTVKYYGVPANDLPTFDISPFFYPSAHYIHDALSTTGAQKNKHGLLAIKELENVLDTCKLDLTPVDEVWPNLYIGNVAIAQNRNALKKMGITHVLNAAHSKQGSIGDQSYYGNTIVYYGIPAEDSSSFDLSVHFKPASDFIHKALRKKNGKVLVHCIMGMSRSATLVLAYLMLRQRLTLRTAIQTVVLQRAIYPNRNFLSLLLDLDIQLQRKRMLCPIL
ncbi:Dual specificity protein phosphatase 13 isoform A [Anabarilius grahami]|uniref:Dual specificity protein phosphatase 13 isoform A n=1 Tax=Anabarilius grahami TaxID=495550 RepID=A0A3N0YUH3_ANAGA|nr:Dual specificity protein phosphatase 13 isoform A [Anabarilius grahami]